MGARSGTVWDTQAQWLGHWECAAPGHEVGGRLWEWVPIRPLQASPVGSAQIFEW